MEPDIPRIMIADNMDADADSIMLAFKKAGINASFRVTGTLQQFLREAGEEPPDIAMVNLELPDGSALDILKTHKKQTPFPIIVMTGDCNVKLAIKAMKLGAIDYIIKSQDAFAIMPITVDHAIREWELLLDSKLYQDILSHLSEAVAVVDCENRITFANRAYCELAGLPLNSLAGRHCHEISRLLSLTCHASDQNYACKQTFEKGEPTTFARTYTDECDEQRHLEIKTYPITDNSGNIKSVIKIINDISEKSNLEAQLRQSLKMEAIGILAGGIAHDFNNVLSAVIGYGHLALMKMGQDDPQREDINNILEGANHAARLTKDLLIFSRKHVTEKVPVDINETIRHLGKFLQRVIGDDVICDFSLHSEPIVVLADTHQLEQVLMNLATNARDAMTEGGHFTISTQPVTIKKSYAERHGAVKAGRYTLITVSDSGAGMSADTCQKIFDPFFSTKEAGKGTGLGLSVIYGIVKGHDGFINVYSEPGVGTTFKIYLPIIPLRAGSATEMEEEEILTGGTETILLAEDDQSARGLTRTLLEKLGYRIFEAVNGEDAVKCFMENRDSIDLLIFDIVMPKMNGKEAYNEIKAWRPGIKAIFMSGYAPDFVREQMQFEDRETLIDKPVSIYELSKEIRRVLDGEIQ